MVGKKWHKTLMFLIFTVVGLVHSDKTMLGGHGGVHDRMGAGAAELGTGNTGTARVTSSAPAYWNPALLAFPRKASLNLGGEYRSLKRNGAVSSLQGRIAPNMGLGLSILNRGDMNVPVYDKDENYLGAARPQDMGFYLGIGLKTSRKNSFGTAIQWFHSSKDIGGRGDINFIGIFNLGWYHLWNKNFKTAVVLRNLGLNKDLSASYELKTGEADSDHSLDRTGKDFFPKTLIVACMYTLPFWKRHVDSYFEFLNFQLKNKLFDIDPDHHVMDFRVGADWKYNKLISLRTGYDRGSISFGFGYTWIFNNKKKLHFDYALLLERGFVTFNPFSFNFKYVL